MWQPKDGNAQSQVSETLSHLPGVHTKCSDPSRMFLVHGFCLICQKAQESQTWILPKIIPLELTMWCVATQGWPLTVAAVVSFLQRVHAKCFGGCCTAFCHLPCLYGLIPSSDGSRWPRVKLATRSTHQGVWQPKDGNAQSRDPQPSARGP